MSRRGARLLRASRCPSAAGVVLLRMRPGLRLLVVVAGATRRRAAGGHELASWIDLLGAGGVDKPNPPL